MTTTAEHHTAPAGPVPGPAASTAASTAAGNAAGNAAASGTPAPTPRPPRALRLARPGVDRPGPWPVSRTGRRRRPALYAVPGTRPDAASPAASPAGPPADTRAAAPEAGITTAEYAVGTAAGAGLAGLLYKMLTGGFGDQLLTRLFDHVLGLLGIG
ncbi:DUF4244 domain-containing protein [Nocardioides sp. Leaf374]|uniref:DUF4244 domain-containing protein n=1 Tax=Nocardioides sp. Leaf374 TaxID=2876560 RepID=UPI001E518D8C|nr:DUF4244 domain-containing protein [Nocardioides sp. Leaf374]